MKIEKVENLNLSFVLTADQVERIAKRCDDSNYVRFEVKCDDGITREFSSTTEFLQFENTPNKAINDLVMFVSPENSIEGVYIHFSNKSIYVRLRGEEKDVLELMGFLHEQLDANKPWYDFIGVHKFSGVLVNLMVNMAITIPIILAILNQITFNFALSLPVVAIVLAISMGINKLVNFFWNLIIESYFPMGVFAINQGLKRHKDKEIIRTVVILGSLSSLFTSVFILFISR
jgi:hypothetical protein